VVVNNKLVGWIDLRSPLLARLYPFEGGIKTE
jgi:hypothetical protein